MYLGRARRGHQPCGHSRRFGREYVARAARARGHERDGSTSSWHSIERGDAARLRDDPHHPSLSSWIAVFSLECPILSAIVLAAKVSTCTGRIVQAIATVTYHLTTFSCFCSYLTDHLHFNYQLRIFVVYMYIVFATTKSPRSARHHASVPCDAERCKHPHIDMHRSPDGGCCTRTTQRMTWALSQPLGTGIRDRPRGSI